MSEQKHKNLIEAIVNLKKGMLDYFGSLPVDLNMTLNEVAEWIAKNKKEKN